MSFDFMNLIVLLLITVGLKELIILHCNFVTPEGILSCVRMPSLERFDYYNEDGVPTSFVKEIIAQNPCLETLAVNLDYPRGYKRSAAEVLKEIEDSKTRRFKTLANMVMVFP